MAEVKSTRNNVYDAKFADFEELSKHMNVRTLPHYIDMKAAHYMPPDVMPDNKIDQQLVYHQSKNHLVPCTAQLVNWRYSEHEPITRERMAKHSRIKSAILGREFLDYINSYEYTGEKRGSNECKIYTYLAAEKTRVELYYDHNTGNYLCELIKYA